MLLIEHKSLCQKRLSTSVNCRLDIAAERWSDVKAGLAKAEALCAEGGDWERKNKLKVASAHSTARIRSPPTFARQGQQSLLCLIDAREQSLQILDPAPQVQ